MLLKYDPHNFGVGRDRSFISPYFGDLDELIIYIGILILNLSKNLFLCVLFYILGISGYEDYLFL